MDRIRMERSQLFLLRYLYFLDQEQTSEFHFVDDLFNEYEQEFNADRNQSKRITDWLAYLEKKELIIIQIGELELPTHYARVSQEGRIYYQENIDQFKEFDQFFEGKNIDTLFKFSSEQGQPTEPQYWLVGSYWYYSEPRERLDIFAENNEWVDGRGKESDFAYLTKQVKTGDILICKSSYYSSSNRTSTLRLKGYGKVLNNHGDGEKLEVEWLDISLKHDIPNYGYYRDTIHVVKEEDQQKILEELEIAKSDIKSPEVSKAIPLHTLSNQREDQ